MRRFESCRPSQQPPRVIGARQRNNTDRQDENRKRFDSSGAAARERRRQAAGRRSARSAVILPAQPYTSAPGVEPGLFWGRFVVTARPTSLRPENAVLDKSRMMIFAGNANPRLAQAVAEHLGLPVGKATVGRFSDGEVQVELLENVRGRDVFLIQPTGQPTNENIMELVIMVDALRRASAGRITTVIPYFGYARQDRRVRSARVPISAKVVANMIEAVGADRVLTIDVHADQVQGFFNVPVDNVYASPVLLGDVWRHVAGDLTVVSPDVGGVVRARAIAKRLDDADLAIIDKRRPRANEAEVMHIIGDVRGKACIIIDDLVDTAGTLCQAARALKGHGAESVMAYATHPVLSGAAIDNIDGSVLDELVVTDTLALQPNAQGCAKIRQLSVAEMLAETIRRINREESVSSLFMD